MLNEEQIRSQTRQRNQTRQQNQTQRAQEMTSSIFWGPHSGSGACLRWFWTLCLRSSPWRFWVVEGKKLDVCASLSLLLMWKAWQSSRTYLVGRRTLESRIGDFNPVFCGVHKTRRTAIAKFRLCLRSRDYTSALIRTELRNKYGV